MIKFIQKLRWKIDDSKRDKSKEKGRHYHANYQILTKSSFIDKEK